MPNLTPYRIISMLPLSIGIAQMLERYRPPSRSEKAKTDSPISVRGEIYAGLVGAVLMPTLSLIWPNFPPLALSLIGAITAPIIYPAFKRGWYWMLASRRILEQEAAFYKQKAIDVLQENFELKESLRPQLAIEFNPADSCVHRFQIVQNDRYVDVYLYRIIVINKSKNKSVENIQVTLDSTNAASSVLPLHLHQMHDNQKPHQKSFNLHPGDRKHIDVVQHIPRNPTCDIQSIDFDGRAVMLSLDGSVMLTISASGTNVAKVSEDFEVKMDEATKILNFAPLSSGVLKPCVS
jgi:hypothetical protein